MKGSGCCFKCLTAFGEALLSIVWLTEGGKRLKEWRNYGQKLSSEKLDFFSMSSFQVVFSGGISIVICISKAKKLTYRVNQQQSWG